MLPHIIQFKIKQFCSILNRTKYGGAYNLATALKYRIVNARLQLLKIDNHFKNIERDNSNKFYSLEQELDLVELKKILSKKVSDLPDKSKLVYSMSREEGYSIKEIAGKMNITEKAVEANLTRALKHLRKHLKWTSYKYQQKLSIFFNHIFLKKHLKLE